MQWSVCRWVGGSVGVSRMRSGSRRTQERQQSDATAAAVLLPSGSDVPAAPLSSEGRRGSEEGGGERREGERAAPRLGQSGSPMRRSSAPRLPLAAAAAASVAERALPRDIEPSLPPSSSSSSPSLSSTSSSVPNQFLKTHFSSPPPVFTTRVPICSLSSIHHCLLSLPP